MCMSGRFPFTVDYPLIKKTVMDVQHLAIRMYVVVSDRHHPLLVNVI